MRGLVNNYRLSVRAKVQIFAKIGLKMLSTALMH